ncbi:MAG: Swt1 family HEPN domain-containing protein [Phycisphaerales bacterium]
MFEIDSLRLHAMRRSLTVADLSGVERSHRLTIVQKSKEERRYDSAFYSQFQNTVRAEASDMADHYEVFYCLEKSIRSLVADKMLSEVGPNWWDAAVPDAVRTNAEKNKKKELDSGMTVRSEDWIDFTTFGELGEIVRQNWTVFADLFSSPKAFDRIMTGLNLLRAPIAHCCPLAEDEVDRLKLTLRDWFRLMA